MRLPLTPAPSPQGGGSRKHFDVSRLPPYLGRFMPDVAYQQCINPPCAATYGVDEVRVACTKCGGLLDIRYDWAKLTIPRSLTFFEHRWSTKGTAAEGRADFSGV